MAYTRLQREANELDLDMFRMIERLEDFATILPGGSRLMAVDAAVSALRSARHAVRFEMHHDDRERTK